VTDRNKETCDRDDRGFAGLVIPDANAFYLSVSKDLVRFGIPSSVSVFQYTCIFSVLNTLSCITLEALIWSRLTIMCTLVHSFDR